MKKLANVVQRLISLFLVNAIAIIIGASMMGGMAIWKSAAIAGISAVAMVVQRLAQSNLDGVLTYTEINDAFAQSAEK